MSVVNASNEVAVRLSEYVSEIPVRKIGGGRRVEDLSLPREDRTTLTKSSDTWDDEERGLRQRAR